MFPTMLLASVLSLPAWAGTPCGDLVSFDGVEDTGLVEAWGVHVAHAQDLRADCAKRQASDVSAALREGLQDGSVDEDTAGELMARLGRLSTVSASVDRGWRLLQQGRPELAQDAAQEATALLESTGLAGELGSTQANRLRKLSSDLWTLAEDAADVRRSLAAGDHRNAQEGAEALWSLAEGWCRLGRIGELQCEAVTSEAAAIQALVQERGQGSVPYLYQQRNLENPDSSGANTAVAMLLQHFGAPVDPDAITRAWGARFADKPGGLAAVFNDYAVAHALPVRIIPHAQGSMAELDRQLEAGTPTIVHGRFGSGGHAVVALRKEGSSYVVNDPGGRWTEHFRGGYGYSGPTDGQNARYGGNAFRKAVATHDGVNSGPVAWHELRWVE